MRIDWSCGPIGVESEGGLPRVLGLFPASAEPILQLGRRWGAAEWFPETSRLALGFILISSTTDRETGYQELREFMMVFQTPPTLPTSNTK
jgi:hypothetical protein